MKFKLDTKLPDFQKKITYSDKLVFLGSCFSNEISEKFKKAGFDVFSNPFGTIFNPVSLGLNLLNCFNNSEDLSIFKAENTFLSWDCSNLIRSNSKENLSQILFKKREDLLVHLKTASHLFITFGSSFGYFHLNENKLVANCHKQASILFKKELIELNKMLEIWLEVIAKLKEINPKLELIFTVSPVRHSKDGLAENNRSKARLFELISNLETQFNVKYFPSYEIVNDELRDYRFFKDDLIHPNQLAIEYVWQQVKSTFLETEIRKISEDVEKLRKLDEHLVFTKDLEEITQFNKQKETKIHSFLKIHPEVKW